MKLCAIWYHLCNLKNLKNTHGTVLLLVKLQVSACNLLKVILFHGCFSYFLNCTNGIKLRKASHFYKSLMGLTLIINPILANVLILYPLKTPENQRFSGVFRGLKLGKLPRNGLKLQCFKFEKQLIHYR